MQTSVTTFDADWTEADIEAALAYQDDLGAKCSGCGHYVDESMADGADRDYEAEPLACHACAERDRAQERYRKDNGDQAGVRWRIKRIYRKGPG